MRTSLKIALILVGLVAVIALLAVGAAAVVRTTHENVVYPDVVYPEEEATVTFTLSISGGTWEDINSTGVTWRTGFIGEFYNHSNDPRASGVPANSENSYSVTITVPDTTGTYILWGWAHTKGFGTDGTQNLGTFEVKETPVVQFGGTLGWNLVVHDDWCLAATHAAAGNFYRHPVLRHRLRNRSRARRYRLISKNRHQGHASKQDFPTRHGPPSPNWIGPLECRALCARCGDERAT